MHLCLKVNKRQRKYHVNCESSMPKGRVTRCVGAWKLYNDGNIRPRAGKREKKGAGRKEATCHATVGGPWARYPRVERKIWNIQDSVRWKWVWSKKEKRMPCRNPVNGKPIENMVIKYPKSLSSCSAASTDITDPLSPLLPIVHRIVYWPTTRPGCQNRKCTYVNNRWIRSRNIRI